MSRPLSPVIEWRAYKDLTSIIITFKKGVEPRTWRADGYDGTIMTCGSVFGSAPVATASGASPEEALAALQSCSYAVNFDGELMRGPEGPPHQKESTGALLHMLRVAVIVNEGAASMEPVLVLARTAVERQDLRAAESEIRRAIEIAQDEGRWIVPGTTIDKTEHTPLGVALRGACEEVVRLRRAGGE